MAHATAQSTKLVTLRLSEEEAEYLEGLLQNPLVPAESPRDSEHRQNIFAALQSVLS